jgi:hypothetical protein
MGPKSDTESAISQGAELSAKQTRLLQNKNEIVRKARDLQAELARVRVELTRIDQEMLKAGFKDIILAGW